jgi:hypothetical protein
MDAQGDWAKVKGHLQPDGTGYVTICSKCNEYSGTHYVPEFTKWVKTGMNMLYQLPWADFDKETAEQSATFELTKTRPLPFVKEIVAMLLPLNGEADPKFRTDNPALVEFVLDKDKLGLPDQYRVYLCLFAGPVHRFAPVSIMWSQGRKIVVTAIDVPPFSYALTFGAPADFVSVTDITPLASLAPSEEQDLHIELLCGFGHEGLPFDYRSSAKILTDRARGITTTIQPVSIVRSDGSFLPPQE